MMGISWQVILFFGLGLVILYFLGKMILSPSKIFIKFLVNSLIGAAVVIIINLVGERFGFYFPVNPFTAITVGVLGVPGVILIFVLKLILGF